VKGKKSVKAFGVLAAALLVGAACQAPPTALAHSPTAAAIDPEAAPARAANRYPPSRPDDMVMSAFRGEDPANPRGEFEALAYIVRHRDGRVWSGCPVEFKINGGSRAFSIEAGKKPYFYDAVVLTDDRGVARVYLQPFPR
jgi:hypothetical protein